MRSRHGWVIVLAILALLVAACGPLMTTPTPSEKDAAADTATSAPADTTSPATQEEAAPEPASPAELPVDAEDWRVLGSPDAEVTIVEYSDFQ